MDALLSIDRSLFHLINGHNAFPFLDTFLLGLTKLGDHPWIFSLGWVFLMAFGKQRERKIGLVLLFLVFTSDLSSSVLLKPFFARPRPPDEFHLAVFPHLSSFGFPSNHAANCFSVAVFLSGIIPKWWVRGLLIALGSLIGFSRIYIGVHYPLDVFGGAIYGSLLGYLFLLFSRRWCKTANTGSS